MRSLAVVLLSALAGTASAQEPVPPARGPGGPPRPAPPFVLMGGEGAFERETVRGLPYSARTETALVHNLADGNRISGRWTGFVARDSEGRVRREQPLAAIGPLLAGPDSPPLTVIHDPVQRTTLFLDADTRTARRVTWPRAAVDRPEGRGPGPDERVVLDVGPEPPRFEGGEPSRLPPGIMAQPDTEALGTREIAGVAAQGTRSTYVIPVGRIGNERPLSVVSERWTSPELNAVLETLHSDPRTGETRFRLTEIDRREPDRGLFEVPAGFAVEDGPPRVLRRLR